EPLCVKNGLGVIGYFSLGSGFLTGKYRSDKDREGRARGERIARYMTPRGFRILAALDEAARRTRSTPAQAALAWLIARPSVTAPIASATTLEQMDDLVAAARLTLPDAVLEALSRASEA
ncbi:MAG: aldo/keto reductase, partial [Elusimicrobia bacterium]|nr:aldo/keto reductase [Elusimicrobiota bacterium]